MAADRIRLVPTQSGQQTVEVDGLAYHSAHNPLREVERFYAGFKLEEADVVLFDRLVSPELLQHCLDDAVLLDVGKAPGSGVAQDEIHRLLLEHAKQRGIVVR